ncbi:MAG: hypothetical protein HW403_22 [Dehalococcoidia bacterium]|nr:hypothetical protein [Dehalococcoidia bacterium]
MVSSRRDPRLRLVVIWLAIIAALAFWMGSAPYQDPMRFTVLPQVPRIGEPLSLTLELSGTKDVGQAFQFELYANGKLVQQGSGHVLPGAHRRYTHSYPYTLGRGQQATFYAKAIIDGREFSKVVALPPYPPQVWSSFVSFASFSTSMMGSISTSVVYGTNFKPRMGFNVGLAVVLVLLSLSVFQELTYPLQSEGRKSGLLQIHTRFQELLIPLLIVFLGIAYTLMVLKI